MNNIKEYIKSNNLVQPNSTILVGLSGGPDSVCLLHILFSLKDELNLNLVAAHLDHEWRTESSKDAEFCKKLCDKLDIKLIVEQASNLDKEFKDVGSKEDLGRKMRRYFFEESAKKVCANFIALGQHLQDQEENFFIRLIRGTSLSGLTGIKAKDGIYIRPLIDIKKEEILNYLKKHNLEFVTDVSNIDEAYLRNRIRKKVIPALNECDSRFDENFLRTLHKLQEADTFIEKIVENYIEENLDIKKLLSLDNYLQKRILLRWLINSKVQFNISESFLDEILKFLKSEHGGKHQLHEEWFIEKKQNFANIKKRD
ncbi:tRNA lysidine(34) synthetase TilS [candidate division TM6 bacterium RIFCSPHIGHO2_12_FULL_32_22]|nr:MAG: tRNA lysidine(34) synthetase TilS [candidate division TM6 bacterium RIFCSPHIGHO2_12_FULL_32_22]